MAKYAQKLASSNAVGKAIQVGGSDCLLIARLGKCEMLYTAAAAAARLLCCWRGTAACLLVAAYGIG
jgi:hypothetical protein